MRRSVKKIAVMLLASGACVSAIATPARGEIEFAPCADTNDFACGHLTVPLDPAGGTSGAITLAIRRHRAPVGDPRTAVIALAGGPGQAAIPFAEQFASMLGPIASTRDLLVLDQRGIGLSHPLSCHRFEELTGSGSPGPAIGECAAQIGSTRAFYTTAQSVADIEAIRAAGGYEKLVLYGTSYGTKVAERYAQAHPTDVEALILDSVVPPNGPDPLDQATFAAVPRILRQLCDADACARITANPVADLAKLVARLHGGEVHGRWIDGHGHGHTIGASSDDLLGALLAGDLAPNLRTEFPAAVRAAVGGDTALLARLEERASQGGEDGERESPSESFDTPLYYATTCEEDLFPWNRVSSPARRLAEARSRIETLRGSSIAPFTRANLLDLSDVPACAAWPFTTPAPIVESSPLPRVPTLILSGAADLRTPTANAREVAAEIPGAQVLVVPHVGHSVLSADLTGCARHAVLALFAHTPIEPCSGTSSSFQRPTPLAPRRLADVKPAEDSRGRPGRTLEAVVLTLKDLIRQLALQAAQSGAGNLQALGSLSVGGLRSGWAGLDEATFLLHRYSYVPGVTVSGKLAAGQTELRIGGSAAARGALRIGAHKRLEGVLEGHKVALPASRASALMAG